MICEATRRSFFSGILFAGFCLSGCVAPYPEEDYGLYGDYDVKTTVSKPEKTRSVDDMLGMKPLPVHKIETPENDESAVKKDEREIPAVKTAVLSTKEAVKNSPDVKGRFGSKEKRFLRKGLNAPAESMKYDETVSRAEIVVVRGLAVQPLSKTEEQKILNDIVASQDLAVAQEKVLEEPEAAGKDAVKVQIKEKEPEVLKKEPVAVNLQKSEKTAVLTVPVKTRKETVAVETRVAPLPVFETTEKQPDPFNEPVSLIAPPPQDETPVFETQMPLIDEPAREKYIPSDDRIVLKAPSEKIVLVPPEGMKEENAAASRVEIYLED